MHDKALSRPADIAPAPGPQADSHRKKRQKRGRAFEHAICPDPGLPDGLTLV